MLPRCNSQSITPRSCVESCPPKFRSFPSRALMVSGAGIGSSCFGPIARGSVSPPRAADASDAANGAPGYSRHRRAGTLCDQSRAHTPGGLASNLCRRVFCFGHVLFYLETARYGEMLSMGVLLLAIPRKVTTNGRGPVDSPSGNLTTI
jgi:hypothetical protein